VILHPPASPVHAARPGQTSVCHLPFTGAGTGWQWRPVPPTIELVVETLNEIRRRLVERARATNAEIPRLEERAATLRQELQKLGEALVATDEKPHTIVRLIADREKVHHDV
jgi:hypothetical protein